MATYTPEQEAAARALLAKGDAMGQAASKQTGVAYAPQYTSAPYQAPSGQATYNNPAAPVSYTPSPSTASSTPAATTGNLEAQGVGMYNNLPLSRDASGDYYTFDFNTNQKVSYGTTLPGGTQLSTYGKTLLDSESAPKQTPTQPTTNTQDTTVPSAATTTGTQAGTQSNIQTGQQAASMANSGMLTMPANGSVVDLLNMAGQDSSFAARQQLAQQFGIQGYTGTAAQNTELGQKYVAAFNAAKGAAPDSAAAARAVTSAAIDGGIAAPGAGDPLASFYSAFGAMDPITAALFQQIAQIDSEMANRQTYIQIFNDEMAKAGVAPLKEDLAQVIADIRLTEDQVREELAGGGGLVLESQVRGIAAARTKVLMTRAEQLSNIISAKEEAVDRIVQLTQADRAEVDAQLDRKLGLTKMLYDMQTQMQDRARENYKQVISDIGYDGLVGSITSQQELQQVAAALGMSPSTLLQLSKQKTSAQRAEELSMLNYQLSVDKFNEDKRQFGLSYALEQQKIAAANAASKISPYSQERASRTLDSVADIRPDVNSNTVGFSSLKAIIPGTAARNFQAKLVNLKSSIAQGELNEMREASKTGGALGQVAVQEIEMLQSSLGALDQAQSVEQFNASLDKVEKNIYRWNAQKMSTAYGFDYNGAKQQGYSDQEIYEYLKNQ